MFRRGPSVEPGSRLLERKIAAQKRRQARVQRRRERQINRIRGKCTEQLAFVAAVRLWADAHGIWDQPGRESIVIPRVRTIWYGYGEGHDEDDLMLLPDDSMIWANQHHFGLGFSSSGISDSKLLFWEWFRTLTLSELEIGMRKLTDRSPLHPPFVLSDYLSD